MIYAYNKAGKWNEEIRKKIEEKDEVDETVGTFWMTIENGECFDEDITFLVVEVARKDHGQEEVIKAKQKELNNLENYETFKEVADEGQDRIMSHWVIMKNMKQDRQKVDWWKGAFKKVKIHHSQIV